MCSLLCWIGTNDSQEVDLYAACTQKLRKSSGKLVYMGFRSTKGRYKLSCLQLSGVSGFGHWLNGLSQHFQPRYCGWLSSRPAARSCLGLPAANWTCLNLWAWTLLGSRWANNLCCCGTDATLFRGVGGKKSSLHPFKTKALCFDFGPAAPLWTSQAVLGYADLN